MVAARLFSLGCVALAACGSAPAGPRATTTQVADSGLTYVPAAQWRTASPSAVGIDSARIATLQRNVASNRYGSIQGLAVVRFGHLVVEQYNGWSKEQAHTLQSVTKSVTSLLFGILADKNATQTDLDRPVLDVFRRYGVVQNANTDKQALTLRHLLTMRTSMDFWEQPYAGSPLDELNRSRDDWIKLVLDRPMRGPPGRDWAYNSGAAILMGGVIREVSGVNVDEFARRELFAPLGIEGEAWARSPFDGLPHCGGGLYLRPLDLARIGYLVLRGGKWGDRQIVSSDWLARSTRPDTRGSSLFYSNYGSGYGYFWWLFPTRRGGADLDVIAASGSGGQWLFVIPKLDLVVAIVAGEGNGLDLLYDELLPAVKQ